MAFVTGVVFFFFLKKWNLTQSQSDEYISFTKFTFRLKIHFPVRIVAIFHVFFLCSIFMNF